MRRRWRGFALGAATCIATVALALLVTIHAYAAGPDDWALPLRVGLFGIGPDIERAVAPVGTPQPTARSACRPPSAAGS